MSVTALIRELEEVGVQLWEESGQLRFRSPRGVMTEARREALRRHKSEVLEVLRARLTSFTVVPDPDARYDPFPLTDVQSAYLLGRRDAFDYGGVACHAYGELLFADLDPARLETAWQALIRRHDMLRAVIEGHASQRVLREVPPYRIRVHDLRDADPARAAEVLESVRAELDHQMHRPDQWPLFGLQVTRTRDRAFLHLSIDFLIADYVSIHLLLDELQRLYREPGVELPPLSIRFRDYRRAEQKLREGPRYERDRRYWWDRIDDLPAAPELPVRERATEAGSPRFRRWEVRLAPEAWAALREGARGRGVTASGAILAAYAEVLGRWSRHPRFTLDVTLLNRAPLHPEVDRLVGDFTSVNLLAVEPAGRPTFEDRARGLQAQLWEDLDHRRCTGVEVMREIARRRGAGAALMPVVFTSAVGLRQDAEGRSMPGEFGYGISQTPQVWIDCQVMQREEALAINWDVREGVFPAGLVDDMFSAFRGLLQRLAGEDEPWRLESPVSLPQAQLETRARVNATWSHVPHRLLHEDAVSQALRTPERTAVIGADRTLSYGDLVGRALAVRGALRERGCRAGDRIAVVMEKGVEQVIAVLGVLLSGATYVPIDTNQPAKRRNQMLDDAGARHVLTQSWLHDAARGSEGLRPLSVDLLTPAEGLRSAAPGPARPADPAYVIYTSGSTGRPKGVMVSHRSAANTVADINRRFAVTGDDRILGLANLGFDLSVYDVFGPLSVGGCLVLPEPGGRGDPSHWAEQLARHRVTLWNSVPSQMQMLVDYLESQGGGESLPLRLALLSGDWIPVPLPERLRRHLPDVELVSLGGATEAAIWSIFHPIGEVPAEWVSIPYGTPLANQTVHVLDRDLRPCPDWVPGELHIGGEGVALGYLGDAARTSESFIRHPRTGERMYRTGDLGRYWPDGTIELLGREDSQVKIRGHRIELAEVEGALQSHPAVSRAVVVVESQSGGRRLAAFAETAQRPERAGPDEGELGAPAGLAERARRAGDAVLEGADLRRYIEYARSLDRVALWAMLDVFLQGGLFVGSKDTHTLDEILTRVGVAPQNHRLLRRWLRALVENDMLCLEDGRYRRSAPIRASTVEEGWQRVRHLDPGSDRAEMIDYFRASTGHLPALLQGEQDPLPLLFPEGRLDSAETLYRRALFNRWANRAAAAAVREIARARTERRPLRVLEVGAGTGATTGDVVEALEGTDVDYLYTDLSQFFLNEAALRFRDHRWVRFGLYDLDGDYRKQGLLPNSFDVILAGDVLHNSRHVGRCLSRMRELLAPGGWLVFLEMTRDHYQIMTSLEFMFRLDGAGGDFEDDRRGRDQIFLSRADWLQRLQESGGEPVLCLPEPETSLSELGMHLFAAQYKKARARVDADELSEHLGERLPAYMVPFHVEIVDALPLSENGKVDRGALRSWAAARAAGAVAAADEEYQSDLERTMAEVWAAVLGLDAAPRDRSFFELGGDSLLAAQLAGRLIEEVPEAGDFFFDDLLRQLLEGPTVARLCEILRAGRAGEWGPAAEPAGPDQMSALVPLGGSRDDCVRVLVHDATGSLACYRALAAELSADGAVQGLALRDPRLYLEVPHEELISRVAACHAEKLLEDGRSRIELVGHGFGAPLAAEVARHCAETGAEVRLIAMGAAPLRFELEEDLLVEYLFARAKGAAPETLGYPSEAALERAIGLVAQNGRTIPLDRLATLEGDAELDEAGRCFRALADRAAHERLEAIESRAPDAEPASAAQREPGSGYDVFCHSLASTQAHRPAPFAGDVTVVCPVAPGALFASPEETVRLWEKICLGDFRVAEVPGDVFECLQPRSAAQLAKILAKRPS